MKWKPILKTMSGLKTQQRLKKTAGIICFEQEPKNSQKLLSLYFSRNACQANARRQRELKLLPQRNDRLFEISMKS